MAELMDFAAIANEVESAAITSETLASKDDLLEDLLSDIDEQEVNTLNLKKSFEGITSREQAEYYIRRYKNIQKQIDDVNEIADGQIQSYKDKVENWRENQLTTLNNSADFISRLLQSYAEKEIPKTNKKTMKFIEGSIGFIKQSPSYEHKDDIILKNIDDLKDGERFLEYLPPRVKWAEMKKAGNSDADGVFRIDGVAVHGVTATHRPDKFVIR